MRPEPALDERVAGVIAAGPRFSPMRSRVPTGADGPSGARFLDPAAHRPGPVHHPHGGHQVSPDQAFALLVHVRQHRNTKLRDIADALASTVALPTAGSRRPRRACHARVFCAQEQRTP